MAHVECNEPGCLGYLDTDELPVLPFAGSTPVPEYKPRKISRKIVDLRKKSSISVHEDKHNYRAYVRTQHGRNSWEIAAAVTPYIGRICMANINNQYGHGHRYRVRLNEVKRNKVILQLQGEHFPKIVVISAWEAFADECTTFEPDREGERQLTWMYGS